MVWLFFLEDLKTLTSSKPVSELAGEHHNRFQYNVRLLFGYQNPGLQQWCACTNRVWYSLTSSRWHSDGVGNVMSASLMTLMQTPQNLSKLSVSCSHLRPVWSLYIFQWCSGSQNRFYYLILTHLKSISDHVYQVWC